MAKRKGISKKLRFEVFKRDMFGCQYCGKKAPDVILEIDHIKPVSKGGDNALLNLTTSCFECNRGKGDRELSDDSEVNKQRMQIEELQERKQQIEMMLQWRDSLKETDELEYEAAYDNYNSKFELNMLSDSGKKKVKKSVKKYGLIKVLDKMDECYDKYVGVESDEVDNFNLILSKVMAFLKVDEMPEHLKKIAYIKGIMRNKYGNYKSWQAHKLLVKYYEDGYCLDDMTEKAKGFRSWSDFTYYLDY